MRTYLMMLLVSTMIFSSCSQTHVEKNGVLPGNNQLNEEIINANKKVVDLEDQQIKNLIKRYGWKMIETGTGLRYMINQEGNGEKPVIGDIATINYEIRLIAGEVVYSSKESGPKTFRIGSGGVEGGLEEAILLLRVGDKAKIIMPSHLAHGLIGDQNRIPGKATLIYDLEFVGIERVK
ncbi:MAG: FKBP-type peptidyl-prolyl cis-trans isomerase [Bacteroidales bacterium]|nr:FKBP-type peptidyl-prolyl cis-trans isomerase [Bacteroidales bacterium]